MVEVTGGGAKDVPSGVIIMWSGSIATIPDKFALCNGSNGTPDLRDKFIVAATQDESGTAKTNLTGSLQQTGGTIEHSHSMPYGTQDNGGSGYPDSYQFDGTDSAEAVPPYYALAFIMKL